MDFAGSGIATKFSYLFPSLYLLKSILELELFGAHLGLSCGLEKIPEVPVIVSRKGHSQISWDTSLNLQIEDICY